MGRIKFHNTANNVKRKRSNHRIKPENHHKSFESLFTKP